VLLKLDNSTAVAYVNHQGGIHSKSCNILAKSIWAFAVERNIWLSAAHVPGVKNTVADKCSRVFYDNKEWSLNEKVFAKLCEQFGNPKIDLFASRLNAKCSNYVSYRSDPGLFHKIGKI